MKPVRIFRHVDCEGPGFLGEFLTQRKVPFQLIAVDAGDPVPKQINDVSGLVFMGGPMSANDRFEWIVNELELIQDAAQAGIPMLGHCLGGQLIAKALGAQVGPNPVKEIGWYPVYRLDSAQAEAWLDGLPQRLEVFHWHGETFSLPAGATHILRSEFCVHQGFVLNNILALQCHIEMLAPMVQEWAERYREELTPTGPSVQSAVQMTRNLEERIAGLQPVAAQLYSRWMEHLVI